MKNKKKILSLIACLSLLSSCNKTTPSSRSCSITTSTPTSSVTPSKTVEELNKELFENYAITTAYDDGTCALTDFKDDILQEYLNLETIIIPETIKGVTLTELNTKSNGLFVNFLKLKTIKIPSTINNIKYNSQSSASSPFINLPNLEDIEVDENNEYYYIKGDCLIRKSDNTIICGWKDVEIPEEITEIRNYVFSYNNSITSIKLNPNIVLNGIGEFSLRGLDNLQNIDLNNNPNYTIEEGSNVLYSNDTHPKIITAWGDCKLPTKFTSLNSSNNFIKTNVTSITISASLTNIDYTSFINCSKLQNIIFSDDSIFKEDSYFIINKNTNDVVSAFGDTYVKELVVPSYVKSLQSILYYFKKLEKLTLNEGLTSLGSDGTIMFNDKECHVKEIKFPSTVEKIANGTFSRMASLENIDISSNSRFKYENGILSDENNNKIIAYGDVDLSNILDLTNPEMQLTGDYSITSIKFSLNSKVGYYTFYFLQNIHVYISDIKCKNIYLADGDEEKFKSWDGYNYLKQVNDSIKKQITVHFDDGTTKNLFDLF